MTPRGARGRAAVARIGHKTKTGGFDKIAASAGKEYGSAAAGRKVAGAIYQRMAMKHRRGG